MSEDLKTRIAQSDFRDVVVAAARLLVFNPSIFEEEKKVIFGEIIRDLLYCNEVTIDCFADGTTEEKLEMRRHQNNIMVQKINLMAKSAGVKLNEK